MRRSTEENMDDLYHEFEAHDHLIPIQRLCDKLHTHLTIGLKPERAAEMLETNGPNTLTPPRVTPEYIKFLKCLFSGFAALLWICAILCFILYAAEKHFDYEKDGIEYFGIIIIVICLVSGIFAYAQESKNTKIMESFTKMVPVYATVIRNGIRIQLPAEDVVIGDLVEIRTGDKIPADIRIFDNHSLRVDNSSLTGESEAVSRTDYPTSNIQLESKNMAFYSTYAVAGHGRGLVIATGDDTMLGHVAGLASHLSKTESPISKEIRHFVHLIVFVALICGFFFFFLVLLIENNVIKAFTYLLGIVIANVPEVLLITVTTSLTLTAKKMADKNCLVKNLEAVETLGSTSVICSDKTGTLTQNIMTLSNVWLDNTRYHFPQHQMLGVERDLLLEKEGFNIFVRDATLCLRAEFKDDPDDTYMLIEDCRVIGDASETGILKFCQHMHPTKEFRVLYPKVAEIPFSSSTKYQLSIHQHVTGYIVIMKGAPEIIMDFCTTMLTTDGTTRDLTAKDRKLSKSACRELGSLGERVLAYCDLTLPTVPYNDDFEFQTTDPANYNFPMKGYRFVGLVSMTDPPRPFVHEAVHKCRTAGIKVIMVTGDHPVTALAIAKKVGIIYEGHETRYERTMTTDLSFSARSHDSSEFGGEEDAVCVTGNDLRGLEEDELDTLIMNNEEIVFARTSPQQKLLIVESCQRIGEIVAVTGDGVNDSPALRKADIGIAMGIAGSDVAKNAADMILLDDNFASIVTGIEEGRLIFDNLKKSIAYTLTSSIPEMLPMLSSIIFGIPLPFVIELVLCIDIGTDLLPAIALAYEKAESDIMHRAPRNPRYDRLVNKRLISMAYGQIGMTQAMAGFYTYFCVLMFHGFFPQDLIGLRSPWENRSVAYIKDSYGQTWDYQSRMDLLNEARTGYFLSIVITQMIDLIMCKTRKNSIFQQGMDNWPINFSFFFEAILTCLLLYVPGTEKVLKTMPLSLFWYWPCLPLGILLWGYDELRRLTIRTFPGGYMEKETYY